MLKKRFNGFTLIELIVVISIIAVLSAILIPSMLGYMKKAKRAAVIIEARNVYTAAAAASVSQYSSSPDYLRNSNKYVDADGSPCGFVTNWMLSTAQNKLAGQSYDTTKDGTADMSIAESVLECLDSENKNDATYVFQLTYNPHGLTVEQYQDRVRSVYRNRKPEPGVVVCYLPSGYVKYVEYGRDGIWVRVEGSNVESTDNGRFVNRTE